MKALIGFKTFYFSVQFQCTCICEMALSFRVVVAIVLNGVKLLRQCCA